MFEPRAAQREVLGYAGGRMGVAAVPGSGKTAVLSALAAKLVSSEIDEGQEVLIVTLVNSAVDNFTSRIQQFLREEHRLLIGAGYRVRTLHGLASDIVRERPSLVGVAEDFAIADEREARSILEDATQSWLATHPELMDRYLDAEVEPGQLRRIKRDHWPQYMGNTAAAFIRRAKDSQRTPEVLRSLFVSVKEPWELAEFCIDVYADYQRGLAYRGKVDFDDLVRYAIGALRLDEDYLHRLQHRWPFILEDEAQDSSRLQQELLKLLVGQEGRWVRVGDSNQAVYHTFTTANPKLLRSFLESSEVHAVEMSESGRSAAAIGELANHLVDWAMDEHPLAEVRSAFRRQHIEPTSGEDPQPNPRDSDCRIHFHAQRLSPDEELRLVVRSLSQWVPEHPDQTVAVLVADNDRGVRYSDSIRKMGLQCVELLRTKGATRDTASVLGKVLVHLADPYSPRGLRSAFEAWRWRERRDPENRRYLGRVARRLGKCARVEEYVWPRPVSQDWLLGSESDEDDDERSLLREFRKVVRRWHRAAGLPIDQLVITLSQDLFDEPADLARAYRFAVALRLYADANPQWRLSELADELRAIAHNERRFLGLSAEDTGFDPENYKGHVVVATMHRAKGLEWDRVYVTAVNNYDFPSGSDCDRYRSEPWYVRDDLDLQAEALGQLEALAPGGSVYLEGAPSREARLSYTRERLRLLYVGITRAKRELVLTWNTGKRKQDPKQPALAFQALRGFWEEHLCARQAVANEQSEETSVAA